MTEYNATLSGDELLNATISEVVETGNHALLTHLDFASSGHTGFQATIGDLSDIRSGAALGATAVQPSAISDMATKTWTQEQGYGTYSKPSGGIPSSDMSSSVQTSLGKADTALQEHQSLAGYATQTWVEGKGYLTEHQSLSAYRTSAAQDVIDEGKQDVLTTSQLAAVNSGVTSTDVTKLSTIESGAEVNVNADWNAASGDAQILNKPTIPTVSVSDTGTATDVVSYITINGTEKKIAGGGGGIPTFEINQSGHLIVSASTQTEANKFSVNSQGHLIYTN